MRPRKYPIPPPLQNNRSDSIEIEGYIDVAEAAEFLRRSVSAIYCLKSRGRLKGYNFGGKLLFKKSELDFCVKSSRKGEFYGN